MDGNHVKYCANPYEAAQDCDALVAATEWNEFRVLDLAKVKEQMRGDLLVDAKNIFDVGKAREAGFPYYGIGRR